MHNSKQLRSLLRVIHLVIAVPLGLFIYSPLRNNPILIGLMGYGVFPLLTVTGLWMWQAQRIRRIRKLLQRRERSASV